MLRKQETSLSESFRADDVSPEAVGKQTIAALGHLASQLEAGALVTIKSDRTRLRLLPPKPEQ